MCRMDIDKVVVSKRCLYEMQSFVGAVLIAFTFVHAQVDAIDCENPQSIREDRIHLCCKHPDGPNEVIDACTKETGFKFPNPKEEAIIDLTPERAIAGTCFANCAFNKLKFIKDNELDMNEVTKYYGSSYPEDPEYIREMINAFDHCHGKTEENTVQFLSKPMFKQASKKFCEPKASVIWACVIRKFFRNCPAERWAKTDECKAALEFSKACRGALTTM